MISSFASSSGGGLSSPTLALSGNQLTVSFSYGSSLASGRIGFQWSIGEGSTAYSRYDIAGGAAGTQSIVIADITAAVPAGLGATAGDIINVDPGYCTASVWDSTRVYASEQGKYPAAVTTDISATAPSGTAQSGQTLTAPTCTVIGPLLQAITFNWRQCDTGGNNCSNEGGTASTLLLDDSNIGSTIRVQKISTKGASVIAATSNKTGVVAAAITFIGTSTVRFQDSIDNPSTTAKAVTAGNLLVYIVTCGNGSTWAGVPTDTAGNTYALAKDVGTTGRVRIYVAYNITGNGANVVQNPTSDFPDSFTTELLEFSGLALASALDKTSSGSEGVSSTDHTASATATLSQASEAVVVAGCGRYGTTGALPVQSDGTYTQIAVGSGANFNKYVSAYKIVSATTAVDWNKWTSEAVTSVANSALITLKAA